MIYVITRNMTQYIEFCNSKGIDYNTDSFIYVSRPEEIAELVRPTVLLHGQYWLHNFNHLITSKLKEINPIYLKIVEKGE